MSWTLEGRPLRRILVARLRYLGDVIMSTVVLEALRRGDPDVELDYLCERPYAPVLPWIAGVDRGQVLDSSRRGSDAAARVGLEGRDDLAGRGAWPLVRALRSRRYDLAVDLYFNPRSAWLLRFAGCRFRITGRRNTRARLYTHVAETPGGDAGRRLAAVAPGGLGHHLARLAPLRHEPTGLDFLSWLFRTAEKTPVCPRLARPADADGRAATILAAAGVDAARPYVVLAPGATWPVKAWPERHWSELAGRLADGRGRPVALTPPGGADATVEALRGAGVDVLPPLPLTDVLAVLSGASLTVSVDGGVMHAAVALGRPVVALFGPTDPALWFPYGQAGPYRVLATRPSCHPCDLHECDDWICMPGLEPGTVADACLDPSLAETSS